MQNKRFVRLTSLFLFLILLTASAVSCVQTEDFPKETGPETEAETKADESYLYDDLPTGNYDGYTFNMLQYEEETPFGFLTHVEEINGEPVNDALYSRSAAVESKLGIDIELYATSLAEVNELIRQSVASNDHQYDVFWQHAQNMAVTNVCDGRVYDLASIEAFDFSKPWWQEVLMTEIAVGDGRYMAVGDINLYLWEFRTAMVFNKDLMKDYGIAYPYESVKNGNWTIDRFLETVTDFGQDLDGDGVFGEVADDLFGLGGACTVSFNGFYFGADKTVFRKDDDNLPYFTGLTDDYFEFFEKLSAVVSDKTTTDYRWGFQDTFIDNRMLFFTGSIGYLNYFRRLDMDFGLVPYPKENEEQESYQSFVTGQFQPLAIPVCNPDPDRTGVILENLAAESYRRLRDPYFHNLQEGKYVRDDESIDMLKLIYASPCHTYIEYVYNWEMMAEKMDEQMLKPDGLSSLIASKENAVNSAIENTIDRFRKFESERG